MFSPFPTTLGKGTMWRSWPSDGSQPILCLPVCLPACYPGTWYIVPVPGMDFKFVNNFPFGLVDVMGLGKSFHSLHLLPCLISSHSPMSQALVVYPFFLFLSSGTCAALPSCPIWLFSSGTLSFLYCPTLPLALFPCVSCP